MGRASRRRYRWTRGLISDYWDEVSTADGFAFAFVGDRAQAWPSIYFDLDLDVPTTPNTTNTPGPRSTWVRR